VHSEQTERDHDRYQQTANAFADDAGSCQTVERVVVGLENLRQQPTQHDRPNEKGDIVADRQDHPQGDADTVRFRVRKKLFSWLQYAKI